MDNTNSKAITLWYSDGANIDANYGPWDSVEQYIGFIQRNFNTNEVLPGTIIALKNTSDDVTKITLNMYQEDGTWEEIGQNSNVVSINNEALTISFKDKFGNVIATTAIIYQGEYSDIKDRLECMRIVNTTSTDDESSNLQISLKKIGRVDAPLNTGAIINSVTIPSATNSKAGLMSSADKSKLDSIKVDSSGNLEVDIDEYIQQINNASVSASNAIAKVNSIVDEDDKVNSLSLYTSNFRVQHPTDVDGANFTSITYGSIFVHTEESGDIFNVNIGKDVEVDGPYTGAHKLSEKLDYPKSWVILGDFNPSAKVNSLFATTIGLDVLLKNEDNIKSFLFDADTLDKIMITSNDSTYEQFIANAELDNGRMSEFATLNFNLWYNISDICPTATINAENGIINMSIGILALNEDDLYYSDCKIYIKKRIFM